MTPWKILVSGISLAVVMVLGSIALFADNPRWDIIAILTGIMVGTLALILGVTALVLRGLYGSMYSGFPALAEASGGRVVSNLIGEKQVYTEHERGRFNIDFRVTVHGFADAEAMRHGKWTRFALETSIVARAHTTAERRDGQVRVGTETEGGWAVLQALDPAEYPTVRVVQAPRDTLDGPAGVAIWLFGHIEDEPALLAAWRRVQPLLLELAVAD